MRLWQLKRTPLHFVEVDVCMFADFFLSAFRESDCDILYIVYILYIIDLLSNQHEFTERTKPSNSPHNKTKKKGPEACDRREVLCRSQDACDCWSNKNIRLPVQLKDRPREFPATFIQKNRYYVAYSRSYVLDTWCFCFQINLPQDLYKYGIYLKPYIFLTIKNASTTNVG